MKSFTQKLIELRITLAQDSFGGKGNTKIIRQLSCDVEIEKAGLPSKNTAKISVCGMLLHDMEQLTSLSFRLKKTPRNKIAVYAGEEGKGVSLIFSGEITSAFADFNAPDVKFKIEAMTGYFGSITPARPMTYQGGTDVGGIISQLAGDMGYNFKNTGVSVQLSNPVLNGSPMDKAQAAAKAAGADLLVDDDSIILSPRGQGNGEMPGGNTVVLRADTGMIGHPSFDQQGIVVKSLYNPAFRQGGLVRVKSIVPKASGIWRITKLLHKLQNMGPDWHTQLNGAYTDAR